MTLELSKTCASYVTTIIHGADVVPTFSPATMDRLRTEVAASHWYDDFRKSSAVLRVVEVGLRGYSTYATALAQVFSSPSSPPRGLTISSARFAKGELRYLLDGQVPCLGRFTACACSPADPRWIHVWSPQEAGRFGAWTLPSCSLSEFAPLLLVQSSSTCVLTCNPPCLDLGRESRAVQSRGGCIATLAQASTGSLRLALGSAVLFMRFPGGSRTRHTQTGSPPAGMWRRG